MPMLRHNDTHPRVKQKGSAGPDLEMLRPDALPLPYDLAQIRIPREPMAPRKAQLLTRQRTSTAAEPSAASDLSCDGGLEPHVPTVSPYAHENRAFEYGACSGDDTWACP